VNTPTVQEFLFIRYCLLFAFTNITFGFAQFLRNFKTRPCAYMPEGGDEKYFTEIIPSEWSEVTRDIWADVSNEAVDAELEPIIEQGVSIALPILEATMRRAWSSGQEGMSAGELRRTIRRAFYLMLRHKKYPHSDNGRWGLRKDAHEGPALLPFLRNLEINSNLLTMDANAMLRPPSLPEERAGKKGVCLQCIAGRDLAIGETIRVNPE